MICRDGLFMLDAELHVFHGSTKQTDDGPGFVAVA